MQPTELRIGNLVSVKGKIITVSDLNSLGIDILDQEPRYYYNELEPIQLTPEILLKVGVDRQGDLFKIETNNGEFIELDQDGDLFHLFIRQVDITETHSLDSKFIDEVLNSI